MKEFEIGCFVSVKDIQNIYPIYSEWAKYVGATKYKKDSRPADLSRFKIVAKARHFEDAVTLYLLENDEGQFIFDAEDGKFELLSRVKEVYEKVGSFSFALEADFNSGILFRPNELNGQGYLKCETEDDVAYAAANEMLFRKVTKPIEWWEDAAEFLGNEASYSIPVFEYDEATEMLTVSATMHRSKWVEFTVKLNK